MISRCPLPLPPAVSTESYSSHTLNTASFTNVAYDNTVERRTK